MRGIAALSFTVLLSVSALAVLRGERAPGASPSLVSAAAEEPSRRSFAPVPQAAPRRSTATPNLGGTGSSLRGRVVSADGAPLRGVPVRLRGSSHVSTTAADGGFVLSRLAAEPSAWLDVAHAGSVLAREVTLWPGTSVDVGDLILELTASVEGRVLDPEGRPVPGARVFDTEGPLTTADGEGRFEVRELRPGRHGVHAVSSGYAARQATLIDARPGDAIQGVRLILAPAHRMTGRILTDAGDPIPNALLEAEVTDLAAAEEAGVIALRTRSGEDGLFELAPLPDSPTSRVALRVKHAAFLPFGRAYSSADDDVRIVLTPARAVLGRVEDALTNEPIATLTVQLLVSAEAQLGAWRSLGRPQRIAASDAAGGRFRVPIGIHCMGRVVVRCRERPTLVSEPFWMGRDDIGPLVLHSRPGIQLRGTLRDQSGLPVPMAAVSVTSGTGASSLVQGGDPVVLHDDVSDAGGNFELVLEGPGSHLLRVRRPGYLPFEASVELDGTEASLEILLRRAGVIRGRVHDFSGARPRLRVVARLVDRDASRVAHVLRPPSAPVLDGEFVFEALEPGSYALTIMDASRGVGLDEAPALVEIDVGRDAFIELSVARSGTE